jgi:hypothetical protein
MIIWVDAIDHWLLFRAFERGQIINNCADILESYRGLPKLASAALAGSTPCLLSDRRGCCC